MYTKLKNLIQTLLPTSYFKRFPRSLLNCIYFLEGTYPLWRAQRKLEARSISASTFTEKVRYKMAYDRNPLLTRVSDKVEVREYVKNLVGEEFLVDIYGVIEKGNVENFDSSILPKNFVLKASHGSGGVMIVTDSESYQSDPTGMALNGWRRKVIRSEFFEWEAVKPILNNWLSLNYFYSPGKLPEWCYKNVSPRILIESLLEGSAGRVPEDYKFYMFDGKCSMIQLDIDRFGKHTIDLFTPNWERLNVGWNFPNPEVVWPAPNQLSEMLRVAERLSNGFDFIRVDLYITTEGIKFGELTNYPDAGETPFDPSDFDLWLGSKWRMTDYKLVSQSKAENNRLI